MGFFKGIFAIVAELVRVFIRAIGLSSLLSKVNPANGGMDFQAKKPMIIAVAVGGIIASWAWILYYLATH